MTPGVPTRASTCGLSGGGAGVEVAFALTESVQG